MLAWLVLSHLLPKVSKFQLGFSVRHFFRSLIHVKWGPLSEWLFKVWGGNRADYSMCAVLCVAVPQPLRCVSLRRVWREMKAVTLHACLSWLIMSFFVIVVDFQIGMSWKRRRSFWSRRPSRTWWWPALHTLTALTSDPDVGVTLTSHSYFLAVFKPKGSWLHSQKSRVQRGFGAKEPFVLRVQSVSNVQMCLCFDTSWIRICL